ncbi:hypothetical protein BS47DRAFT_1369555 [Hydnum rufescens UP504]|uniref:Uncharacterized protein n=1 Tax=Hydnum rufescens UP504 TaxID=1448309 RepID=A0A9P6ACI1_9AGAM|nr:hypothetical protein BS47DRAFT_1369555 [Hydnum rufescens UP504]
MVSQGHMGSQMHQGQGEATFFLPACPPLNTILQISNDPSAMPPKHFGLAMAPKVSSLFRLLKTFQVRGLQGASRTHGPLKIFWRSIHACLERENNPTPLGHASDSTVRPASDSTVRPASNSTATCRSNRSKLKEVALPVDPSKESNDAVCMLAKTKAGAKPSTRKAQKKGLGDERGGAVKAQKAACARDIHKEPEKVADPPQALGVANRETANTDPASPSPGCNPRFRPIPNMPHIPKGDSEAAEVAKGLEGPGTKARTSPGFPADQFEEPLDSERSKGGCWPPLQGWKLRHLTLTCGISYSEDPGKASKDTEVPSSSESNGQQARAVELAEEQAEWRRRAKGKGKEAEAEADDEAEEESWEKPSALNSRQRKKENDMRALAQGDAGKSCGGPWNDFTRLYSAENPDHGLATVELSEIYRKEKVKASKEGKEGYKNMGQKYLYSTRGNRSQRPPSSKTGKDLSEKGFVEEGNSQSRQSYNLYDLAAVGFVTALDPTDGAAIANASVLPFQKIGDIVEQIFWTPANKRKFMALNLAEADTFEPSIKGWEAYAEANPPPTGGSSLYGLDRVLKQNGVLEGWGKKGWPTLGWPILKEGGYLLSKATEMHTAEHSGRFVKGANSRQEGYPLVFLEQSFIWRHFPGDMEDGNLALVFDQKKNPLLRLWDSTKWRKMDALKRLRKERTGPRTRPFGRAAGKSSTVLNIGLRIWKMLRPASEKPPMIQGQKLTPKGLQR